jgi:hypothetical protein
VETAGFLFIGARFGSTGESESQLLARIGQDEGSAVSRLRQLRERSGKAVVRPFPTYTTSPARSHTM